MFVFICFPCIPGCLSQIVDCELQHCNHKKHFEVMKGSCGSHGVSYRVWWSSLSACFLPSWSATLSCIGFLSTSQMLVSMCKHALCFSSSIEETIVRVILFYSYHLKFFCHLKLIWVLFFIFSTLRGKRGGRHVNIV